MNAFLAQIRQMIIPGRGGEYGPLPPLLVAMTVVTGLVDGSAISSLATSLSPT
jgi:hypothetical protein